MSKKIIYVIGASRGLGELCARSFANDGWTVVLGARSENRLRQISAEINEDGGIAVPLVIDVSNSDSVSDFFEMSEKQAGVPDAVLFLAGKYGPFGRTEDIIPSEWLTTIQTNLFGAFLVLRESLKSMEGKANGHVLLLSGGGATAPMPTISAYASSKAGLVRLVESVALEQSPNGIRVNALAPGLMATDMLEELLETGDGVVDSEFYNKMVALKKSGEDSTLLACEAIKFLITEDLPQINGRLISAKWDSWEAWNARTEIFDNRDLFTLRRQV